MNVLVVIADRNQFAKIDPFLVQQDIRTVYARTLADAIQIFQKGGIEVVLISWNLPLVDVSKTFQYLDEKLPSIVAVFSELDKPQIVRQLVASRITKTIFPPLSGPGVLKRLAQLRRQFLEEQKKGGELGMTSVTAAEVPRDIEWEASGTPGADGEKFWQGVSASDESHTYIYQGKDGPKWDEKKNSWNGTTYLKVNDEARARMGALLGAPIVKKAKVTVLGLKPKDNLYSIPATNRDDGSQQFYDCLTLALNTVNGNVTNPVNCEGEVDHVTLSWIQAPPIVGLITIGDVSEAAEANVILHSLHNELKNNAEKRKVPLEIMINRVTVPHPAVSNRLWAEKHSKYVYGVQSARMKLVLTYIRLDKAMQTTVDPTSEYISVPVIDALRIGARIPIDVHVFMKKNQKFIRLIAANTVINDMVMDKLKKSDIQEVMIRKTEMDPFLQYKTKYYLGLTK